MDTPKLRIVFMGTPPLARESLAALLGVPDWQVVAVVTQPDRPKGRALACLPSPVKELALAHALPVLQPPKAREAAFLESLRAYAPDLIVVAAYGHILPPAILELPRFGCLNVHTSLLPKYRGAAPIQWAIAHGETETGVTIMQMDAGMDTGGIVAQQATPIAPEDDSQTLHDRLAALGAALLVATIPGYVGGELPARPQPAAGASHAPKVTKADGHMAWNLPARTLWNRLRAFTPWPGAYTFPHPPAKSQMLKLWHAEVVESAAGQPGEVLSADKSGILVACGTGALRVLELQPEGGRRMKVQDFLAGHAVPPGTTLG